MNNRLWGLALAAALSGPGQAQAASIWGALDVGLVQRSGVSLTIGKRDANPLGFKGIDELGSGLKALFQREAEATGSLRISRVAVAYPSAAAGNRH